MLSEQYRFIEANGLRFGYLEAGEGPLVLCLHGFPDTPATFKPFMARLAESGFRAVAPATRGIHPTERPKNKDYSLVALATDTLALIEAFDADSAAIVGHDWGALIAYTAANMDSPLLSRIVTIAIPHPRAIRMDVRFMVRAWHFGFLAMPYFANFASRVNDFALLRYFLRAWSPGMVPDPYLVGQFTASYSRPGTLQAALGYYRAFMLAYMGMSHDASKTRHIVFRKTAIPTLCFAGLQDGVLDERVFDRTPEAFEGPYELVKLGGAGHFLHLECPEDFYARLMPFLWQDRGP